MSEPRRTTCPQCGGVGRWPHGDDLEPCGMCRENGFIDAAVYPVTWQDEDGGERNTWSRNRFTGEIERDPDGDPLYTTVAPGDQQ